MDRSGIGPIDSLFIGYEQQENLGLRSIIATLEANGFSTCLEEFVAGDHTHVIDAARALKPALIGISIIFQYTLDEVALLTRSLREAGIESHITVGGHFPSLEPLETFRALPEIDSVVRFEGEITALELLRRIDDPKSWSTIEGLAFRDGSVININEPRPLIADLDSLPQPIRSKPGNILRGIRSASILASRGCLYNCSFCSIRQFYGGAPGPLRRVRSPEAVAGEMLELYQSENVRFFNFQDDDFAAKTSSQRTWIHAFLKSIRDSGLDDKITWKISCRVDDVDGDLIQRCKDHGLIAVYLGVESGNTQGLRTLNKGITPEQSLSAIAVLNEADIAFDIGFMLFDPETTIESIRENIKFLGRITAEGACPVNFCKMLPYAGTPIAEQLAREGRLRGTVSQPDYDFHDPRLDWYAIFVAKVFRHRNFDNLGLVERLRLARFDQVLMKAFEGNASAAEYGQALEQLTSQVNQAALSTLEAGLDFIDEREEQSTIADWNLLQYLADREWEAEASYQYALDQILLKHSPEIFAAYASKFSERVYVLQDQAQRIWSEAG